MDIVEIKLQFLSVSVARFQINGLYMQFLQRSEINGEVGSIHISEIQLNIQLIAKLRVSEILVSKLSALWCDFWDWKKSHPKQRRHYFWIFDTPIPHVGSFLVLAVGDFYKFWPLSPNPFMDGP